MKQIKTNPRFFVIISVLFIVSCNQPATISDKNDKDTAQIVAVGDATSKSPYNPALDPLIVAGPNGKLLHDSLGIKIYEVWVKPGELGPLHSHPDHAMYVLQGGKARVYFPDIPEGKNGIEMEFKAGEGWVTGPVVDSARNIGNTTIKLPEVDVHRRRSK